MASIVAAATGSSRAAAAAADRPSAAATLIVAELFGSPTVATAASPPRPLTITIQRYGTIRLVFVFVVVSLLFVLNPP